MKKIIKFSKSELIFISVELIILISLIISIRQFDIDIYSSVISVLSLLISIFLTIKNKNEVYMPYASIVNNAFLLTVLGMGFTNNNFNSLMMKFRLVGIFISLIIFILNFRTYEYAYLNLGKPLK